MIFTEKKGQREERQRQRQRRTDRQTVEKVEVGRDGKRMRVSDTTN